MWKKKGGQAIFDLLLFFLLYCFNTHGVLFPAGGALLMPVLTSREGA